MPSRCTRALGLSSGRPFRTMSPPPLCLQCAPSALCCYTPVQQALMCPFSITSTSHPGGAQRAACAARSRDRAAFARGRGAQGDRARRSWLVRPGGMAWGHGVRAAAALCPAVRRVPAPTLWLSPCPLLSPPIPPPSSPVTAHSLSALTCANELRAAAAAAAAAATFLADTQTCSRGLRRAPQKRRNVRRKPKLPEVSVPEETL